jgi:hypothetical protein
MIHSLLCQRLTTLPLLWRTEEGTHAQNHPVSQMYSSPLSMRSFRMQHQVVWCESSGATDDTASPLLAYLDQPLHLPVDAIDPIPAPGSDH